MPIMDDSSFRLLAERALDLIFRYRVAPEPGFEYISPSATDLLGYTAAELEADPNLVLSIVTETHMEYMDRLGPEGWRTPYDVQIRRKDGSTIWIEQRLIPVFDDDGELIAIEGIARDVTGRKQAERRLEEKEQQLAEAQQLAHVGSWEWDIADSEVTWSDELFRIYGLVPGSVEVTYESYLARVHPDDRELAEANVGTAFERGQPFSSDYRIVRPDGEVRWLHSRGRLETDSLGDPVKMLGICLDITARKQAEEDRRRLQSVELQHRQAMEIHDGILQGLTVASMALALGDDAKTAEVLDATLATARGIVSSLLTAEGEQLAPEPGDLRRTVPAMHE